MNDIMRDWLSDSPRPRKKTTALSIDRKTIKIISFPFSFQQYHTVDSNTYYMTMSTTSETNSPLVGVLALQGAFEEHQKCLKEIGCRTLQVRRTLLPTIQKCFFLPYERIPSSHITRVFCVYNFLTIGPYTCWFGKVGWDHSARWRIDGHGIDWHQHY